MIFIGRLRSSSVGRLGEERDRAGTPDGTGELALVPCAAPGNAPGCDLASLRDKPLEAADVLVVDHAQLVDAELADLAATESAPLRGLACRWNGSLLLILKSEAAPSVPS